MSHKQCSSPGSNPHAYPIERARDDPFRSDKINYQYLLVQVDRKKLTVTMNRLDFSTGKACGLNLTGSA